MKMTKNTNENMNMDMDVDQYRDTTVKMDKSAYVYAN